MKFSFKDYIRKHAVFWSKTPEYCMFSDVILKGKLHFSCSVSNTVVCKPEYCCWTSPVDECTFCITISFKGEGYTENTLIHRWAAVISRLNVVFSLLLFRWCWRYSFSFVSQPHMVSVVMKTLYIIVNFNEALLTTPLTTLIFQGKWLEDAFSS